MKGKEGGEKEGGGEGGRREREREREREEGRERASEREGRGRGGERERLRLPTQFAHSPRMPPSSSVLYACLSTRSCSTERLRTDPPPPSPSSATPPDHRLHATHQDRINYGCVQCAVYLQIANIKDYNAFVLHISRMLSCPYHLR
jgi:hypothetical protein